MIPLRHSPAAFQPTRWTLIAEANGPDRAAARAALEKLCAACWYPLYGYVRRRGLSPEDAEDSVQGFFARLIERDFFAAVDRERGRLRAFLLHQMDCWLADASRRRTAAKRGGGVPLLSMTDAEVRYAAEKITAESPETLYHRQWALTLLSGALTALEEAATAAGKAEAFHLLKPALTAPTAEALDTKSVAEKLGIPRDQVRVRVHRLRAQFREVLRERIAETLHTSRAELIEEEMHALLTALRPVS
jgi:RNA polymerase sigma factor (sigma-70 family)